ncbi:MAG: 30S ribosomal protein S6 [Thermoguttaceae bacterium]|nr:30S ribosomal protein S6 [Thermoguttaceae bacterium]
MALNVYEGMFILDSGRYARDPEGVAAQVNKLVTDAGGEILVSRQWEERRLAYPIKGQRKGLYWLMYFRLESTNLAELNRQFSLYDVNIRNLFIKIDPRIVDELVKHAEVGPAVFQDRQLPETEDEENVVEDYEEDEDEDEE